MPSFSRRDQPGLSELATWDAEDITSLGPFSPVEQQAWSAAQMPRIDLPLSRYEIALNSEKRWSRLAERCASFASVKQSWCDYTTREHQLRPLSVSVLRREE
jgi:hypothetical protein